MRCRSRWSQLYASHFRATVHWLINGSMNWNLQSYTSSTASGPPSPQGEAVTKRLMRRKTNSYRVDYITHNLKLQSGAGVPPSLLHYYFLLITLQKILNAILGNSEEVISKNPEYFRIQDFLEVRLTFEPGI